MVQDMNGHVKRHYALHRDNPLILRDLLAFANAHKMAVAVDRDDERGTLATYVGVPFTITMDRLTLVMPDGGNVRFPLYQIDRAALMGGETWEAA